MWSSKKNPINSEDFPNESQDTVLTSLPNPGDLLRKARLEQGKEVSEVAEKLRIREAYINAMEENNIAALPDPTYGTGFLRIYARFLGLEPEVIVEAYRHHSIGMPNHLQQPLFFPVIIPEGAAPNRLVLVSSLMIACVMIAAWYLTAPQLSFPNKNSSKLYNTGGYKSSSSELLGEKNTSQKQVSIPTHSSVSPLKEDNPPSLKEAETASTDSNSPSDISPQTHSSPIPQETLLQDNQESSPSPEEGDSPNDLPIPIKTEESSLKLTALTDSWVEIRTTRQILLSRVLRKGEQAVIPYQSGLYLTTGNAGGLQLTLKGQQLTSLGQPGEVRRDVVIDEFLHSE